MKKIKRGRLKGEWERINLKCTNRVSIGGDTDNVEG